MVERHPLAQGETRGAEWRMFHHAFAQSSNIVIIEILCCLTADDHVTGQHRANIRYRQRHIIQPLRESFAVLLLALFQYREEAGQAFAVLHQRFRRAIRVHASQLPAIARVSARNQRHMFD